MVIMRSEVGNVNQDKWLKALECHRKENGDIIP